MSVRTIFTSKDRVDAHFMAVHVGIDLLSLEPACEHVSVRLKELVIAFFSRVKVSQASVARVAGYHSLIAHESSFEED